MVKTMEKATAIDASEKEYSEVLTEDHVDEIAEQPTNRST